MKEKKYQWVNPPKNSKDQLDPSLRKTTHKSQQKKGTTKQQGGGMSRQHVADNREAWVQATIAQKIVDTSNKQHANGQVLQEDEEKSMATATVDKSDNSAVKVMSYSSADNSTKIFPNSHEMDVISVNDWMILARLMTQI